MVPGHREGDKDSKRTDQAWWFLLVTPAFRG